MQCWIRYSTATGQIHEAAFYTIRAAAMSEEVAQIEVIALPNVRTQVIDLVNRQLRMATNAERAAIFPPMPDAEGFFQDLQVIFTRDRLRAWVDPLMVMSWMRKSYANLKLDFDAIRLANKVTQAEYDQVVAAARNRNLTGW